MKNFFLKSSLAVCLCSFMACSNSEQQKDGSNDSVSVSASAKPRLAVQFNNKQQAKIYTAYERLKNDLVRTDAKAIKVSAKLLATELAGYQGCQATAQTATAIANTADIKAQRKSFTTLSNDLIALFKHADLKGGTIYVQHCPMANHGDGGDWLSSEKKIQNPYYGDEMMECGAVVEEIKVK